MAIRNVCVLGGTGFVGQHLVPALGQCGYRVRVLTRHRERHRDFWVLPRVTLVEADVHSSTDLHTELQQCDAVINLVGVHSARRQTDEVLKAVHVELPRRLAEACQAQGISRLLHVSAVNASASAKSGYLRSKGEGEGALQNMAGADPALAITILRPAPIFGPQDQLFNRFARWLTRIPVALPVACPEVKLAPVWVKDVVQALLTCLEDRRTFGNAYDLCGPRTYRLVQLVRYTARVLSRRRYILPLNDSLSRWQARLLRTLSNPLFIGDNDHCLEIPEACGENGLLALGIKPIGIDAVVPKYLKFGGEEGLYSSLRCSAGRH